MLQIFLVFSFYFSQHIVGFPCLWLPVSVMFVGLCWQSLFLDESMGTAWMAENIIITRVCLSNNYYYLLLLLLLLVVVSR